MNSTETRPAGVTVRTVMRIAVLTAGAAAVAALLVAIPRPAAAGDEGRWCSNYTLRGDYGLLVTGQRFAAVENGVPITESFARTSLRTYDGRGSFTQVDNGNGQLTGSARDQAGSGVYTVNADCSGVSTLYFAGAPPIETAFVIVDRGREIKDVVVAPAQLNLVTAVGTRVR